MSGEENKEERKIRALTYRPEKYDVTTVGYSGTEYVSSIPSGTFGGTWHHTAYFVDGRTVDVPKPYERTDGTAETPLIDIPARRQLESHEDRLKEVEQEIQDIRREIEEFPMRVQLVETREVTQEEAETLILAYMKEHEKAYPSDVAFELGIPLKRVVEVLEKLACDGRVRGIVSDEGDS